VDWQKAIISSKPLNSQNLSVSGGTKNFTFNISGSYLSQEGNERSQNFKRISLRANSDLKVGKYLKFGESILLSSTNRLVQSEEGTYAALQVHAMFLFMLSMILMIQQDTIHRIMLRMAMADREPTMFLPRICSMLKPA